MSRSGDPCQVDAQLVDSANEMNVFAVDNTFDSFTFSLVLWHALVESAALEKRSSVFCSYEVHVCMS